MKSIPWSTPRPNQLAAYLEDELAAPAVAELERQLAESSDARRELEQLSSIRTALSHSGREFEEVDLLPAIHARLREHSAIRSRPGQGLVDRRARARPMSAWFAVGSLAAAVCLGVAFAPRFHSTQELRAKSAQPGAASARWAGVTAYRVQQGVSEPLGATLHAGDGLLFSYTNLGPAPLSNLMIFAVDSRAEVHWFHPAYERAGMNPASISIEKGGAEVPLAELIQDEFPAGPLTIHALFSPRPLQVLEVEAWLKRDPESRLVDHASGSVDRVLHTRVEP